MSTSHSRSSLAYAALIAAVAGFASTAPSQLSAQAVNPDIVISQVYGGGGNSGALYTHDFVELFNRGASPVSLAGWSLQYASATGTGNLGANSGQLTELPATTLAPGQYFLVQQASQAAVGSPLPTADFVDATPIAMAAGAGKVALVNTATGLGCNGGSTSCSPTQLAQIIDLVGYGSANFFEGAGTAPTLSATTAAARLNNGCTDTNNNSADFGSPAAAPAPRNTASPLAPCSAPTTLAVTGAATPSAVPAGQSTLLTATVTPATSPTSTNITVTADLSTIGGGMTQAFFDNGTSGDVTAGDNVFSFQALVDAATTAGPKSLAVSVADAESRTASTNIALTVQGCTVTHTIAAIQGSGAVSPLAGTSGVTARGIVTGLRSNGFFLQMPVGDGDSATSDGILVFTNSAPSAAIVVGADVCVTGTVTEFAPSADPTSPPVTEIASLSGSPIVFSTGNALPAPIAITAADTPVGNPDATLSKLESLEGMRVSIASLTVVGATLGGIDEPSATATSNGVFYGVVSGLARPVREPGIPRDDAAVTCATPPCHFQVFDGNPERIRVDSDAQPGTTALNVSVGATVTGLRGPLDYAFRTYTILQDAGAALSSTGGVTAAAPAAAPRPEEITVAGFNFERFFDTVNDPNSDPVLTPTAFANRLAKASGTIRSVLRLADVIGAVEVENLATLQAVATKVNDDEVAAGRPNPDYVAYLEEGNDIGGIDVGFLVKRSRITVVGVTQEGKSETYIDPSNGQPATLNDRPSLVLDATALRPDGTSFAFTVIVNHLRSLNSINNAADGARVRAKRAAQAEFLANLVQARQTADPNARILLVGDFNAFEFNDGYVDSIGTIKGAPAPGDTVAVASPDLVNPNLTNLVEWAPSANRYSYVFDGSAQVLDHALASAALTPWVSRFTFTRSNADFAETVRNDAARPERLSDHDATVTYVAIGEPAIGAAIVGIARPSTTLRRVTLLVANTGTANAHDITLSTATFTRVGGGTNPMLVAPALPYVLGTLAPGQTRLVTLDVQIAPGTNQVNMSATASYRKPDGTVQPVVIPPTRIILR